MAAFATGAAFTAAITPNPSAFLNQRLPIAILFFSVDAIPRLSRRSFALTALYDGVVKTAAVCDFRKPMLIVSIRWSTGLGAMLPFAKGAESVVSFKRKLITGVSNRQLFSI
ncbi:MAG TPA: hypothetical protein VEK34_02710 [Methylocella sp.]|nr:hypothetical protein [Methylocella sp.]